MLEFLRGKVDQMHRKVSTAFALIKIAMKMQGCLSYLLEVISVAFCLLKIIKPISYIVAFHMV